MSQSDPARVVVHYQGQVQGVGFRMTAVQLVRQDPVTGWVRNEPDGSVRLEAEGPRDALEAFLGRIDAAMRDRIRRADVSWSEPTGRYQTFEIAY
jgi:acylphosphatase